MNKAEYLRYLNFNEEEFSIQPYDEEWLQKIIEQNKLKVSLIELRETLISKEFFELLKEKISKSIKKIEIPIDYLDYDLDFLNTLQETKELTITSYGTLSSDFIKSIQEKTKIRKVNYSFYSFAYEDLAKEDNYTIISNALDVIMYKDLFIKSTNQVFGDSLTINTKHIDKENLEKLTELFKENNIYKILVTEGKKEYGVVFDNDKDIKLHVKGTISDLKKAKDYFSGKYNINTIEFKIDKMDYENIDLDTLEEIYNSTNFNLCYDNYDHVSFDEFKGLVESIKYYRSIINEGNLSPVEKVMYAYDIMKTFSYKESKNKSESRNLHKIIETGNIVCVGYSEMLKNILTGLDKNIGIDIIHTSGNDKGIEYNHARNIVRIDDEKYNMHGIYALDSTWDSVKEDSNHKLGENYNALDLYRYFLIPMTNEYKAAFPNESEPYIVDSSNCKFFGYEKLFNESLTKNKLDTYFNINRPNLEEFIKMLTSVRLNEGFTKEDIKEEVNKVIEKNKLLLEYAKEQGETQEFFKPSL